ncbi:hypothetical protein SK128_022872, partial [Halocaridina rubra]
MPTNTPNILVYSLRICYYHFPSLKTSYLRFPLLPFFLVFGPWWKIAGPVVAVTCVCLTCNLRLRGRAGIATVTRSLEGVARQSLEEVALPSYLYPGRKFQITAPWWMWMSDMS